VRLKAFRFSFCYLFVLSSSIFQAQAQTAVVDSLRNEFNRFEQRGQTDSGQRILQNLVSELIKVNLDSTEFYLKKLEDSFKQRPDSTAICTFWISKGTFFDRKGNIDSAGHFLRKGYLLSQKLGKRKNISMAANAMASMYFSLKNYPKTLDYMREALKNADTSNHKLLATLNNNLGTVFNFNQQKDSALVYFNEAIKLADRHQLKSELASVYASLLTYYYHNDDFNKAIYYGKLAIPLLKSEKMLFKLGFAYNTMATSLMYSKQYDRAEKLFLEGLRHSQEREEQQTVAYYFRNLSELYELMGKYKEALKYSQRYVDLQDTINSEDLNSKISEIESELSLERKNRELQMAIKDGEIKQAQLDKEISTRNALITIIALVLILVGILIYNNMLRQKANKLLAKEKEWEHDRLLALESKHLQLQKDHLLAQFETLRNQVDPHFLFNSLNALNTLIKTDPDKALNFSQKFSSLFRKVLELRNQHLIPLAEELDLVQNYLYLQGIRYGENLKVKNELISIGTGQYIPPFSLQLLVENAIKHNEISEDYPLSIRLYTSDDKIIVSNSLRKRSSSHESTGTGLKNLLGRYKYFSESLPEFYEKEGFYVAVLPMIEEDQESA
jgi:tetratricopeptide (TPR) repeat protein